MKLDKVIICPCGCGSGVTFERLDEKDTSVGVSFISSDFYNRQGLFRNVSLGIDLIRGKRLLKDIWVERKEVEELQEYLLSLNLEGEDLPDNYSHIIVEYDSDFGFGIQLISDVSLKDAVCCKGHRAYSLTMNDRVRNELIKSIDKALTRADKLANLEKVYADTVDALEKDGETLTGIPEVKKIRPV